MFDTLAPIRNAEAQLIERGWLRTVELPHPESTGDLGMFVELTPAGRRVATRRVLLKFVDLPTASAADFKLTSRSTLMRKTEVNSESPSIRRMTSIG